MKFISLPIQFDVKIYKLNSIFGILLEFEKSKQKDQNFTFPQKLMEAVSYCNNPYKLSKMESNSAENKQVYPRKTLSFFSNALIKVNKLNFGLGRLFSGFGQPVFENANQAIHFFRNNKPGIIQNDLCLPRSLFAASTSKKFKENGVIFIGVSLPSNLMHAWIIEDGKQPDPLDTMWINFQPVAAIF